MCAFAAEEPAAPVTPKPAAVVPLDAFGYRAFSSAMMLRAGYANSSIHFIDPDHLLLTFTVRKLIPRSAEQRETDDDHFVRVLVMHLPDGKVVREAEWRLHDRAPYLWPLSHGRFLLRVRNDLFALDPMGDRDPERMGQQLLLRSQDDLRNLEFSPEHDTVLVETTPAAKIGDDPMEKRDLPVTASFYQVSVEADGEVRLIGRGTALTKSAFSIPFTSMGVLQAVQEDRTHWGFDFRSYAGRTIELAGFTTTCRPHTVFISDAEFFAFGCRGGEDLKLMGGFNLLSEAKWVFTTDDPPLWLTVSTSSLTGRFAVRNTLTTVAMQGSDRPDADEIRAQEIRVYGSREGEELLRVNTSPAQRPAGNFALSTDGLRLAVLQGEQLAVYNLPPVSDADRKLHQKEQAALAPLRPATALNIAAALATQ